jgi:hypothetical protein
MIDIQKKTEILIKEKIGVSEDAVKALFDIGLFTEHNCKRVLIREEYFDKMATRKKTDLKIHLAEKYCVSFAAVESYIYNL